MVGEARRGLWGATRRSVFAIVTTVFMLGACGGRATTNGSSPDEQADDEEDYLPDVTPPSPYGYPVEDCFVGATGASHVTGIDPAEEYDALSFVRLDMGHYPEIVVEQNGLACPDSGVESTCLLEIATPLTGFYTWGSDIAHALVVTIDDEHEALGHHRIREVLGEIDTANEAAILAWTEGFSLKCDDIFKEKGSYFFLDTSDCEGEEWIEITPSGTVSASAFCL